MSDQYLYLALNIGSISIPLIASFYPKARFASTWRHVIPAILLPIPLFIIWDSWFTSMGVWGFNECYLMGVQLFNLPLEEWLFFITIPYACLFTYFAFKHFVRLPAGPVWLSYLLGLSGVLVGLLNNHLWYTSTTFIGLGIILIVLGFLRWPHLPQFLLVFLVILVPFFVINGLLTGSWIEDQVVWYNDAENLGIRLGTVPLEDVFYGMFLLLLNTFFWESGISSQQE